MKTRITELLGIEYPIVCGGMMRVGTAELAAAQARQTVLGSRQALAQAEARVDQAATRLVRAEIAQAEGPDGAAVLRQGQGVGSAAAHLMT